MSVVLTLTAAGHAAIADAANRATRAVQLRRLAVGTGTAPASTDDSARTALRAQREIAAVTGDTTVPARIAFRADYRPDAAWNVTEIGLFARIGAAGDEFLFAYWVAASAADAAAAAVDGALLVIAGIVEITQSAADIDVTVGPTVRVGAPGQATTTALGIVELATAAEAQAGTDTQRVPTPSALAGLLVPTGTVLDFAGVVIPSGYLLCDGRAVSRTTYAALYAVLGIQHGAGDGSTTFQIPDLRRQVTVGSGGAGSTALANSLGSYGGAESVQISAHSHAVTEQTRGAHEHTLPLAMDVDHGTEEISIGGPGVDQSTTTGRAPGHTHGVSVGSGGARSISVIQPSKVMHKIIKT